MLGEFFATVCYKGQQAQLTVCVVDRVFPALFGLPWNRVMRNLKSALKILHHRSQYIWDVDLHMLTFAFNTAYHESTKTSLDKLFLGKELRTP
jgi:hypothetical protein